MTSIIMLYYKLGKDRRVHQLKGVSDVIKNRYMNSIGVLNTSLRKLHFRNNEIS